MPSRPAARSASPSLARHGALLAVVLVLLLTSFVRLRLADGPLERDEGEYAYAGQLILQGVPPYTLAYNMKFPGTYYAYSAILAVFGETPWGIRAGLLCISQLETGARRQPQGAIRPTWPKTRLRQSTPWARPYWCRNSALSLATSTFVGHSPLQAWPW